jgi:hypothetical protein
MVKPINPTDAIIVCGRTLRDFALCGKAVPPDVHIHRCWNCGAPTAITPEGQARLDTPGSDGCIRIVTCSSCVKVLASRLGPGKAVPMVTAHGAQQAASSSRAKKKLDEILAAFR